MPPGKTDDELASEFADYFLDKIERISEMFEGKPAYISEQSDVPRLRRFSPMTQSELKTIMLMQFNELLFCLPCVNFQIHSIFPN